MLTLRALLLALAATLALPGAAHAARTFTLGKGYSPAVAVEKDGTGHFAWFQDAGTCSGDADGDPSDSHRPRAA
jgi:hypothetical protein